MFFNGLTWRSVYRLSFVFDARNSHRWRCIETNVLKILTAARFLGWQTIAADNRLLCINLQIKSNASQFNKKLKSAQHGDFGQSLDDFQIASTVKVGKAKLKATEQYLTHEDSAFRSCVPTFPERFYRRSPFIDGHMALITFTKDLRPQSRWKFLTSKLTSLENASKLAFEPTCDRGWSCKRQLPINGH